MIMRGEVMNQRAKLVVWMLIALPFLIASVWFVLNRASTPADARSREHEIAQTSVSRMELRRVTPEAARSETAPVESREAVRASETATVPASKTDEQPPALEQSLDHAAATFLSDRPDVSAMRTIAIQCARDAIVDETSIRTEPDGSKHGKFMVAGTKLQGSFQIVGDDFRVEIPLHAPRDTGDTFIAAGMSVNANDGAQSAERAGMTVQFHPQPYASSAPETGERIVGWTVHRDANGSMQFPITMSRADDGRSVIIGNARSIERVPLPGDWDVLANDAWLKKLRKFK
jgi:hypothetical protein